VRRVVLVLVLVLLAGAGLVYIGISRSVDKSECYGRASDSRSCDAMPDGDDLTNVGLAIGVGSLLVLTIGLPIGGLVARSIADEGVRRRGRDAPADVVAVRKTGLFVNEDPQVVLKLRVRPPDGAPYEASLKSLVSQVAIPRAGDRVAVRYDPANRARVALLKGGAARPAAGPTPDATPATEVVDHLATIASLRESGVITPDEYETLKRRLLHDG